MPKRSNPQTLHYRMWTELCRAELLCTTAEQIKLHRVMLWCNDRLAESWGVTTPKTPHATNVIEEQPTAEPSLQAVNGGDHGQ
jgi:hypothetical protein